MDSIRQNKFSRLILKEIADILQREGRKYFGSSFVTVTNVKVSPDLSSARVYLSIFKDKNPDAVIEHLQQHMHEIRKTLGTRIRSQARIIPELKFFLDDSLDYADKIEKLLNETKPQSGNIS